MSRLRTVADEDRAAGDTKSPIRRQCNSDARKPPEFQAEGPLKVTDTPVVKLIADFMSRRRGHSGAEPAQTNGIWRRIRSIGSLKVTRMVIEIAKTKWAK